MAKPVIPQGFVLDEPPQANQQGNFGLPAGFQLDDESQSSKPKMSMGEAVFTTATNPLGFGDEIKAGISAGVAKLFGGQATQNIDIGDLYREARTSERAKLDKARQNYPSMTGIIEAPSDLKRGAAKGLEEVGLGIYQTAADFGVDFSGAKAILSKIRPDLKNEIESLTPQDISSILGEKAAQNSKATEQEGLAYKTGRFIGKVAPFLGVGGGSATGLAVGGGLAGGSELMEDSSAGKRLGSAAVGAVVAPVVGGVVQRAIPVATNIVKKGASTVKNFMGKKTGEEIAQEAISPETARKGLEQLKSSPEGQPTTALDIDSPEFQALAKTAVSRHPQAKQIAADFAAGRKEEAAKRIGDILSKDISPVKHAFDKIEDLDLTRKIAVKPVIAQAYKEGAEIPTLFKKGIINTSRSKSSPDTIIPSSFKRRDLITGEIIPSLTKKGETMTSFSAREGRVPVDRSGYIGGKKPLNSKEQFLANQYEDLVLDPRFGEYSQDFPNLKPNSVEMLHNIRKSVDKERSALEKNLSGISPTAAASRDLIGLNNFRAKITNLMYKATGSFEGKIGTMEKADKIYAGESKLMDAVKEGMNFKKFTQSEIVKKMRNYSPGERDAYRIGVRQDLQTNMNKATKIAGKSSPSEKIFNDLESQKRLRAVFLGDKKKYEEFAKRMGEEISYDKTIKNLGLNKQDVEGTNRGLINMIARVVAGSKTGMVFEGVKAAETAMIKNYKGLNDRNAKELIRAFTDKKTSIRILENIVNKADSTQKPIIYKVINDIYSTEKGLIQNFLEKRNFTKTLSPQVARTMVTEQPKNEENLE